MSVRTLMLLLVAFPLTLSAQETPSPDSEPATAKETVVVTATRSERGVSKLPISTTVVTEEELRATPVLTVDDLLRTIPGVQTPLSSSLSSTVQAQRISMRGLGGTRTLVLLDGVPVHDPYYGTVEWQKVPLEGLRQIEVVRGASASLFGNLALGGTIHLLTRPVDAGEVRLNTSYGSNATQRASLNVDHEVSPTLGLRLSHDRFSTNGTFRFPNPGPIDVPGWNDLSVTGARADYRPSERASGFFKAVWSDIKTSQGTALSDTGRSIFDVSASMQHALGARGLVSATLFHQHEDLRITSATTVGARLSEFISSDSDIPASNSGLSLEWSTQRTGSLSFLGLGIDVQDVEATERAATLNRAGVVTQRNLIQGHQRFAGLFGQASWRPAARLEILTSARVDHYKNDRASDEIAGGATKVYPSTTSTQLNPRVSVRYELAARTAVRGSAYRGFKAPTLRELYRTNQAATSVQLANPFLEPETLIGAELGFEWARSRAHVEVNVFRNDIDGLQVRAQVPGQPNAFRQVNLGSGRSQGIETAGEVRLPRGWSVVAAYSLTDSVITDNPVDSTLEGKQTPDAPRHLGSLELRYRGQGGTSVSLRGRQLSRSYGEPANLVAQPAHRIVDFAVSRPIRSWIDAYALLENAFDEDYFYVITATSFRTGQPRTFSAGVRVRIPTGSRGNG
jgi:outer membrane receptor protein involved in Fe transport